MRSIISKLTLLLLAAVAIVGCTSDSTFYSSDDLTYGDSSSDSGDYGYLTLSNLTISVVQIEEEVVDSNEANTKTRSESSDDSSTANKALSADELSDYWLTISSNNLKDPVEVSLSYADFYTEAKDEDGAVVGYPLLAAHYDIVVDSKQPEEVLTSTKSVTVKSAAAEDLGEPKYRGYGSFQIKSLETTDADSDIICDLNNVKVSLELSADLKAMFKAEDLTEDDIPFSVTISMGHMNYIYDGTESSDTEVYFDPEIVGTTDGTDQSDTINISLRGMYNTAAGDETPSYSPIDSWDQTITGVTVGQSRAIGIRIEYTNEGNVEFVIEVENWVYNDKIDIDILSAYANTLIMEEVVVDPESLPRIELVGGTSDNTLFIPMTDSSTPDNIEYRFTPRGDSATIDSFTFSTPNILNGAILTWSAEDGELGEFGELFEVTESSTTRKVSLRATDAGMEMYMASAATYSSSITVVDSQKRSNSGVCVVNIGEATAPTVVWRDKDIYVRQEVTASGLDFIIDITSSTAITGFTVDIESDVLSASDLADVKLNAHMDLINPDASYSAGLEALGFPMGDEIEGQTVMVFDVSEFMESLYLFGEGDSDFILTITNSAGKTTVATAGVYVGSTENPDLDRPESSSVTISWADHDFDTRYDISDTTDLSVSIDITAEYGINNLMVAIDSSVLTEAYLNELNLSTNMDLVNPDSEKMGEALKAIYFPIEDEVEGLTELTLDISEFMPVLALMGSGYSDFKITVIDSVGNSATKTIMVNSTYVE